MKITPCCKTRHWHSVLDSKYPYGMVRCDVCDKMFDEEDLINVIKEFNTVTYYCDKCHSALRDVYE